MLRNFKQRSAKRFHRWFPLEAAAGKSSHDSANPLRFESLEPRLVLNGQTLVISELMAVNDHFLADENGDYSDWIEVHNPTTAAVNLDGWFLTDDGSDLRQWRFPDVTLESNDYRVVFASDKDRTDPLGELHTNFKLRGEGEYLALVRPDGTTVEHAYAPEYPPQFGDISYGLGPNLTSQGFFATPTPWAANTRQPADEPIHHVVINEIMYHPFDGLPTADPPGTPYDDPPEGNDREDYIELFNRGSEPVELLNWQFADGVQFTFPDLTLDVGEYLVVAADLEAFSTKYPDVTNVTGGWDGRLNNSGETVELVDQIGRRIDRVRYSDEGDWADREAGPLDRGHYGWVWSDAHDGEGKSLELINPEMSNDYGQNWTASDPVGGTPGVVNSAAADDVAPIILDAAHSPTIPQSTDQVTVTARLRDELGTGITGTVYYRVDGATEFTAAAMQEEGQSGVYVAELPAQPDGTVVEFYIEASDGAGRTRTWPNPVPAPTQPDGHELPYLLYQVDDAFDPGAPWQPGNQPIYRLILTEAERLELEEIGSGTQSESETNAQMSGTFIAVDGVDTDVRYNVGIRNRGQGTRNDPPNNYRVNFPGDRPWQDVDGININSKYTHLQLVGSTIIRMAGLPAEDAIAVEVRMNGEDLAETGSRMYGSYVHQQAPDSVFAEMQFPGDGEGNVYRCTSSSHQCDFDYHNGDDPRDYIADGYQKSTNSGENDWTDLINLCYWLSEGPDATYAEDVERVINVDQWLRWFAVQTLIGNNETNLGNGVGDDYLMYRGIEDPRFVLIAHDLDTVLGLGNSGADTDESIFQATGVAAIDRFLTHPAFVGRYYAELQDLIATVFSPEQINPLLDHALSGFVPASVISQMKDWDHYLRI